MKFTGDLSQIACGQTLPAIPTQSRSSGFPGGSVAKDAPVNAGDARDAGLTPGAGRSPGGGNGNLLQYACLENPMDRGTWRAIVRGLQRLRHD